MQYKAHRNRLESKEQKQMKLKGTGLSKTSQKPISKSNFGQKVS